MWVRRTVVAAMVAGPILLIGWAGVSGASMPPSPPSVTLSPQSTTVALGHLAHFKVRATGSPRPTYQWQVSTGGGAFTNLGVSTSSLGVAATFATDGNRYRAVVANANGTVDTQAATLTVEESKYIGEYTLHYTLGPRTGSGPLTLDQDGQGSDGATLDIVHWSASGKTVTVQDGNDSGEVLTFVGPLSSDGIATPRHPGTVAFSDHGSVGGSGTFYATRVG